MSTNENCLCIILLQGGLTQPSAKPWGDLYIIIGRIERSRLMVRQGAGKVLVAMAA